jgi:predicted aspartyl protease
LTHKKDFFAFTARADGRVNALKSECHVCAAFDPSTPSSQQPPFLKFVGLWDTGATGSVITQKVVDACSLLPYTMQKVVGAYGGVTERNAYLVAIGLPNHVSIPNVTVVLGELHGTDVLIGMDVITLGDFAITHEDAGKTVFSFRIPSLHTIDYSKQATHIRESKEAELAKRQQGSGGFKAPGRKR